LFLICLIEKTHQQYQGVSKTHKKPPRKKPVKKSEQVVKEQVEKPARKKVMKSKDDLTSEQDTILKEAAPENHVEGRSMPQEIITSSGKKIVIQTTLAGESCT